jgi:NAD(P)-dependent dehydrogenase (short-subunit alcohol dehydrogenase family)
MNGEAFRFDGKRAVVVGGATGMGEAAVGLLQDLGADVVDLDLVQVPRPGVETIEVNLADKASIDHAVDACGGTVDALFCCAGVADGTPGIEKINFLGHRHLIDRMRLKGMLPKGSAIAMISSAAGLGWEANLDIVSEYLATTDFDAGVRWIEEHPHKADYLFSKQALCAYVASQAFPLLQEGIRINCILPGPTDTPLAQANAELWLGHGKDYRDDTGTEASTPEEQAGPLVFLCSDAARYVSGITLITDLGYISSGIVGSYPSAAGVVGFLRMKF